MKKYAFWARRNPLQNFGIIVLIVALVNFIFWTIFGWDFTWRDVLGNVISLTILEIVLWNWRKYEKENNVTTILYKDRKKAEEAAQ